MNRKNFNKLLNLIAKNSGKYKTFSTVTALHNNRINWTREPATLFAYAKNPPDPLTSYTGRYMKFQL